MSEAKGFENGKVGKEKQIIIESQKGNENFKLIIPQYEGVDSRNTEETFEHFRSESQQEQERRIREFEEGKEDWRSFGLEEGKSILAKIEGNLLKGILPRDEAIGLERQAADMTSDDTKEYIDESMVNVVKFMSENPSCMMRLLESNFRLQASPEEFLRMVKWALIEQVVGPYSLSVNSFFFRFINDFPFNRPLFTEFLRENIDMICERFSKADKRGGMSFMYKAFEDYKEKKWNEKPWYKKILESKKKFLWNN